LSAVFSPIPRSEVRVQAKTIETLSGIWIEEYGPIIKLLSEHDIRIAYGFITVFHDSASRFPTVMAHTEAHLSEDMERFLQLKCQGAAIRREGGETQR